MEFLLELFFGILFDGLIETTGDKRVPLWGRILIASVLILLGGLLFSLIAMLGFVVISNSTSGKTTLVGILLLVFALVLLGLSLYRIRKIYRKHYAKS